MTISAAWIGLALATHAELRAQIPQATGADSITDRRRAIQAQDRFERVRRQNLPSLSGHNPCDVRIGRYCYWYTGQEPPPPPEPPRTVAARLALVRTLDSLAGRRPGDEWIAGQHVRYLMEAARSDDAAAVATDCRATRWWCAALLGFTLHGAGAYARAESAFASALREMPDAERCRWADVSHLIEGTFAKRYREASCAEREAMADRLWWLARPFQASDANDLRSEHYARVTQSRMLQPSRTPYGAWGGDQHVMGLRYGWPIAWSRDRQREGNATGRSADVVRGHEDAPSFAFIPTARALREPFDARDVDWTLAAAPGLTRYAPRYARYIASLPYQLALFRRGDSLLVTTIVDVGPDSVLSGEPLDAALVLSSDSDPHTPSKARVRTMTGRAALQQLIAPRPQLVSLEVRGTTKKAAARARFGMRPPSGLMRQRLAVSDVLLVRPGDALPHSLDAALPGALGATTLVRGARVVLFWEVYDSRFMPGGALDIALHLDRLHAGAARRVAELLRVTQRPMPVAVRLRATASLDQQPALEQIAASALALDLGDRTPGLYRITLVATASDGTEARSFRDIQIVGRDATTALRGR